MSILIMIRIFMFMAIIMLLKAIQIAFGKAINIFICGILNNFPG